MSRQKIRWAIGSSDGPRSSTWVLWENKKGDIYVAVRSLGGIIKASFHRDGKCQVGFTSDYSATASRRFGVANRLWEKWQLPENPVVRVLQILIPHSELRSFADRNPTADVTWLPAPPGGSIGAVSIFISKPEIERFSLGDVSNAIILGNVQTVIRTAWVVYVHYPMDPTLAKRVDDERMRLKRNPRAVNSAAGARVQLWEHKEGHDRYVLELACH
jgi:hypothetical protein